MVGVADTLIVGLNSILFDCGSFSVGTFVYGGMWPILTSVEGLGALSACLLLYKDALVT